MAISAKEYLSVVSDSVPEARVLVDRHAADGEEAAVWVVNDDLVHLLLWSWRTGDGETCNRILGVMELGLVDTRDDDYAPVWNSLGIGVVETIDRDLQHDDFVTFVETWPPAMRKQGRAYAAAWDEIENWDEGPDTFRLPLGVRVRWAVRHPISSRLGSRMRLSG